MNKTTPKKTMEIIYIFILPLLFILFNISLTKNETITEFNQYTSTTLTYNMSDFPGDFNPIASIFEYICEALEINIESVVIYVVIDYINLWFIMFITWHLLYLFFDTVMHKVLLRKE